MDNIFLPTLTLYGNIPKGKTLATFIYEYFLLSDYSQSNTYYGNISSLKYLIAKHQDDENDLKNAIIQTLTKVYKKYFTNVIINVNIVSIDKSEVLKNIEISIIVDDINIFKSIEIKKNNITLINDKSYLNLDGIHL